jgi:hypothetical protein
MRFRDIHSYDAASFVTAVQKYKGGVAIPAKGDKENAPHKSDAIHSV